MEVRTARLRYTEPLNHLYFKYQHERTQIQDALHRYEIGDSKRHDAEDKLLYNFCEATQTYCYLMSELKNTPGLDDITQHALRASVNQIKECAEDMLRVMRSMQKEYQPNNEWHSDFVNFGKMFYKNDSTIQFTDLMLTSLGKIEAATEDICRAIQNSENKEISKEEMGVICQKLGQNKVLLESCLLPYAILQEDERNSQILATAKYKILDPFIKSNQLESHVTPRGFMFGQTIGFDSNSKSNYVAKPYQSIRVLTNSKEGLKLVQEESALGTRCQFEFKAKDKRLKIGADFTASFNTQYDPKAKDGMQFAQKTISAIGSVAQNIEPVEHIIRGNPIGLAKSIAEKIQISYNKDYEHNESVDINIVKLHEAATSEKAIDVQDAEQLQEQIEGLKMFVDCAKQMLENSDLELESREREERMGAIEDCSTIYNAFDGIATTDIGKIDITETVAFLTDIIYKYQDIGELPRAEQEVQRLLVAEHNNLGEVVKAVEAERVRHEEEKSRLLGVMAGVRTSEVKKEDEEMEISR